MRRRPTARRASSPVRRSARPTTSRTRTSPTRSGTGRRRSRSAWTVAPTAVHGLRRLDPGLDRDQGLTLSRRTKSRPRQRSRRGGRRSALRVGLLLLPPMLWLGVAYLGGPGRRCSSPRCGAQNDFTGEIERVWSLDNYRRSGTIPVYRTITFRTIGIAALVTVVDAVIAFPIALYMAKVASPRLRRLLVIAVLMPLWASYLVKAYAWRGMFSAGRADRLAGRAVRARIARLRAAGDHDHAGLPVAALHDPADLRRAGARARLAVRGVGRPGRRLR